MTGSPPTQYRRSLSAQGLARLLYIGAGLALYVLVARLLGSEALGRFAYAVTILTVAAAAADAGTTSVLARDLALEEGAGGSYLASFLALRAGLGLVVGAGLAAVVACGPLDGLRPPLYLACAGMPLFAARFYDPAFQIAGRPWTALWLGLAYAGLLAGLAVPGLLLAGRPLQWAVLAFVVAGLGYGLLGLVRLTGLFAPLAAMDPARLRAILGAAAPFGLSSLLAVLCLRADLFILAALRPEAEVGLYNAAFRFFDAGNALVITVLTPFLSILSRLRRDDPAAADRTFEAMLRRILLAVGILAAATPCVSDLVMAVVYGPGFAAAAPVLDLMAWKFALAFVNLACLTQAFAAGRIRFVLASSAAATALNLALNFLWIPSFGMAGAATAAVVSELLQATVAAAVARRVSGPAADRRWYPRYALVTAAAAVLGLLPVPFARAWLLAPVLGLFGAWICLAAPRAAAPNAA